MFKFSIPQFAINDYVTRYKKNFSENLVDALDQIRISYIQQLRIEQSRGNSGGWPRLNSSYQRRKEREYPGQPILSRTGVMMAGYFKGVRTVPFDTKVVVDFPGQPGFPAYIRARAHQGFTKRPKGMPIRAIPVSEQGYNDFVNIAIKEFSKAINKTLNE